MTVYYNDIYIYIYVALNNQCISLAWLKLLISKTVKLHIFLSKKNILWKYAIFLHIFFLSSFSQLYALFFFYFLTILSITSPKNTKHKEPLSQQPSASPLGRFSLPHDPIIGSWSLGTKGRGSGSCLKLPHINIEYLTDPV